MNKSKSTVVLLFALSSCVDDHVAPHNKDQFKPNETMKASHCIYWFKVSSGETSNRTTTSQTFVYSSCADYNLPPDDLQEAYAENTSDLVSAGGLSLPANALVGDTYEYTSPQGDFVRYTYTADRGWRAVERIIPVSVAEAYPDVFAFLSSVKNVIDGEVVPGPDDLYFTFEGGLDQWRGKPE
jgi:hypothetical protein